MPETMGKTPVSTLESSGNNSFAFELVGPTQKTRRGPQETSINLELKITGDQTAVLKNNKQTIIMAPDGSKKGWDVAIEGERIRDMFIKKLESFDYEDGSNPFDFVEVSYGEYGQKVLRGNCDNMYDEEERDDGV